jgi:hypothetical protein
MEDGSKHINRGPEPAVAPLMSEATGESEQAIPDPSARPVEGVGLGG